MYKRTGKIAIFHGISRKTAHFTENHYAVRVTAVKSRNRLSLSCKLRPKYDIDKLLSIFCGMIKWHFWHTFSAMQ